MQHHANDGPSPVSLFAAIACAITALTVSSHAQCSLDWQQNTRHAGVSGSILATAQWDPDGTGPLGPVVVCGGLFLAAGDGAANNIATYDPATRTWATLGDGFDDAVHAVAVLPGGILVAAGAFQNSAASPLRRIAWWDGVTWQPLSGGVDGEVNALLVASSGDLYVGGAFGSAGTVSANRVARWNGAWSPLAQGFDREVNAIDESPNGEIAVGGEFDTTDGQPGRGIAIWDGASWMNPGGGLNTGSSHGVDAVRYLANGELVIGGNLLSGPFGLTGLAKWDGLAWTNLLNTSSVDSITQLANGDLIIGGALAISGGTTSVARLVGTTWVGLGLSIGRVRSFEQLGNGDLAAAGSRGLGFGGLPIFDGSTWRAPAAGTAGKITAIMSTRSHGLVAGGRIEVLEGVPVRNIGRFEAGSWHAMGGGIYDSTNNLTTVTAILERQNGDIVVAGGFTGAGTNTNVGGLASWDGSAWSSFAGGALNSVTALTETAGGDLLACGDFFVTGTWNIVRWDGASWIYLAQLPSYTQVLDFAWLPNGDLVAAGTFTQINASPFAYVARWDGSSWHAMGGGFDAPVTDLVVLADGQLVAGGEFSMAGGQSANRVARWDGTTWSAMGGGLAVNVRDLVALPNGDVAASTFWSPAVPQDVWRWDGSAWISLAWDPAFSIQDMVFRYDELVVLPQTSNAFPSSMLFALRSDCSATVDTVGAGCASSVGVQQLQAHGAPWAGSVWRATATSMPTHALAVAAYGAAANVPLGLVLPQAGPGCMALTTPDFLQVVAAAGGVAFSRLDIPDSAALAGLTVRHQVVTFEFDSVGNYLGVSSTDALDATIGLF